MRPRLITLPNCSAWTSILTVGLSLLGMPSNVDVPFVAVPRSSETHRVNVTPPTQTKAIVQLQGLNLSPPTIQGTTTVLLQTEDTPNRLMIEGVLQEQAETFLVDTGASTTLLSKALVSRLNLKGQPISGNRLSSAVAGQDCPNMDAHLHQLPPLTGSGAFVDLNWPIGSQCP